MRVLIGCECSGIVRDAFIARGHDAWSCDLQDTERPGPHIKGDVLDVIDDGWDLGIFHPECKFLTISAEWAYGPGPYHQKVKPDTLTGAARQAAREDAKAFVKKLWNAKIDKIAIENPIGVLSKELGKPQIIQPHQFGEDASKATCLWLKNLPQLRPTFHVHPRFVSDANGKQRPRWANQTDGGQNKLTPTEDRAKERARTYVGVATAMAAQWSQQNAEPKRLI